MSLSPHPLLLLALSAGLFACQSTAPQPAAQTAATEPAAGKTAGLPKPVQRSVEAVVTVLGDLPERHTGVAELTRAGDEAYAMMRAGPLGSGVLVGSDLVLTHQALVRHAGGLSVRFLDGREVGASIAVVDPGSGLAVLRLDTTVSSPEPLVLASADSIKPGDPVVAIGNPFGAGPTITRGIAAGSDAAFLHTDAAIHYANTGGALVNLRGELLGINDALAGEQLGLTGISVAASPVAVQRALASVRALEQGEVLPHLVSYPMPFEGLEVEDIHEDDRQQLSLGHEVRGALVSAVAPGSRFAKAGIEPGDVIVELDLMPVMSAADVTRHADEPARPGPTVLLLLRDQSLVYLIVP